MFGQICSELHLVLGKAVYFHYSYSQLTWMTWISYVTERETEKCICYYLCRRHTARPTCAISNWTW